MKIKTKAEDKAFKQGYFCAAATLMRAHGEETLARSIITEGGYGLKDADESDLDPFDLEALKEVIEILRQRVSKDIS